MNLPQEARGGGSVPVFLRKPIATCNFPVGPDPLLPSGTYSFLLLKKSRSISNTVLKDACNHKIKILIILE